VRPGVAVEGHDLVDRRLVAQECERRDQGTRAPPCHNVQLGLGEWVLSRHRMPPFEKPSSERSPIPSARDDQDVEHRRFLLSPRGVPVVLGLGAFEQPGEHSGVRGRIPFRLFAPQFQEILLGNVLAFWKGTIADQRDASGECGRRHPCERTTIGHDPEPGGKEENYRSPCSHESCPWPDRSSVGRAGILINGTLVPWPLSAQVLWASPRARGRGPSGGVSGERDLTMRVLLVPKRG